LSEKAAIISQAIEQKTVLFAAAASAVKMAAARYPLAIASGARKAEICHILQQGGLQECFGAIVSAEDVEFGKPNPEPFLQAHAKLKERDRALEVSTCVAIEDSIGGIQSAHNAGMRCLAIAHSYGPERLRRVHPEWIINSIADFVPWLEKEACK
jgi:beta-phosphoglucomutase